MFRWTYSAVKMFSTASCHSNASVDNKTYPSISAGSVYVHDYTMNCDTIYTIILLKSVCLSQLANCRSQFLLDRLMSQTVRLDRKHFLSRVRVSVWTTNFLIREKHAKLSRIPSRPRDFIWMKQRPAIDRQRNRRKGALTLSWLGATDPSNNDNLNGDGGVRACMSAHACVCACVMCLQYTIIIFDPGW